METNSRDRLYHTEILAALGMIFGTSLMVSNIIAGKMWAMTDNVILPASVILFPLTYLISDIVTEVYGFARTKTVIFMGFICNFFAVVFYVITVLIPHPAFWLQQDAFAIVLGMTPRVLLASFLGYFFGEFSHSYVFSKLKVKTNGDKFWLRMIGSAVVGEALDSAIFSSIAFAGMMPVDKLIFMIIGQYLFKVVFESVLTPVMYLIVCFIKKKEGIDTYDTKEDYKLFVIQKEH